MWRDRLRAVLNWCLGICLSVLLLGSATLVAQPPSLVAECEEYSRRAAEQQSILLADTEVLHRAEDRLAALHTTLRGFVARLQATPEDPDQVIRGILAVLSQMKQARADVRAAFKRFAADDTLSIDLESQLNNCFDRLDRARRTDTGAPAGLRTLTLILTVLDRTETVNISSSRGKWDITGRFRQGIKLPSNDPAATDTTGPVSVSRRATAEFHVNPGPPSGWTFWLGIGADSKTPLGETLCNSPFTCQATSGPYPGVRRGFGKGWGAAESVEVWLCPAQQSCVGMTDPVASVNIHWVVP